MRTGQAGRRLRECEREIEAIARAVDAIAHELNNALTVITGTIDLLAEAVSDEPQLVAVAKLIEEAAQRGTRLTQQLFALRGGYPSQPAETDIHANVRPAASRAAADATAIRQDEQPSGPNRPSEQKRRS